MARSRILDSDGIECAEAVAGGVADRTQTATAVRYFLQVLTDRAPGNTVEVRVPPFGAAQVIEGPRHTRGTPPNVVEMDAATWVAVATGALTWGESVAAGRIAASGQRADLSAHFPLISRELRPSVLPRLPEPPERAAREEA